MEPISVASESAVGRSGEASGRWYRRLGWWALAVLAFCVLVTLLDLISQHADPSRTSDQASLVLEGRSLSRGNVLLHGWSLSFDSFWTTEVPFYGLATLILGVTRTELALVPAAEVALVVVVGGLLAIAGRRRAGSVAAGVTVVAFVVLAPHALASFLLAGGHHIGALLFSLAAFYALRRARFGPGVVVAAVLLAVGMLGDLLVLAYGTVPVLLAGIAAMLRTRRLRSGAPSVTAAGAAVALALLARWIADELGTFGIGGADKLASSHQVLENVRHLFGLGGELLGLRSSVFGTGGVPSGLQDAHLAGGLLVLACSLLAVLRLVTGVLSAETMPTGDAETAEPEPPAGSYPSVPSLAGTDGSSAASPGGSGPWWRSHADDWHVEDMLVFGALGSALSYLALSSVNTSAFVRYLTACVVFMIILAARELGRYFDGARRPSIRTSMAAAGAAVVACFGAGTAYQVAKPLPHAAAVSLASWLEAHDLTRGVGAYWASNIVTVESDGRVRVAPVRFFDGQLRRYGRESTSRWYAGREFDFVVYDTGAPAGGVSLAAATQICGPLRQTASVDRYVVFVCSHPFTISATHDVAP